MNDEAKRIIQINKEELQRAEKAHQKWLLLSVKRDELELKEQELIEKFQSDNLALHRMADDDEQASAMKAKISQQEDLINQIKKKKQELDSLLDSLEELSDDKIKQLREALINDILKESPDQAAFYQSLSLALERTKAFENELRDSQNIFNQLVKLLDAAITVRKSVKKRGIFSYILGVNPNISISQYLHAAESLTVLSLPTIAHRASQTLGGSELQEKYQEIHVFLNEFRHQCKMQWGFRHIDTIFTSALERIKGFQEFFENEIQKQIRERENLQKQVDNWMDAH